MSIRLHGYRILYGRAVYNVVDGEREFSHNVERSIIVEATNYKSANAMAYAQAAPASRTYLRDGHAIEATKEFVDKVEYLGVAGWERSRVYNMPLGKPRAELVRDIS